MTVQGGMHDSTQCARAFSVNNLDVPDAPCKTFINVMRHEILDVSGRERVKVERAVDWHAEWCVHQGEYTCLQTERRGSCFRETVSRSLP